MLKIRCYQPADRETVWNLHNEALAGTGAHAGYGSWDDDLYNIEEVYINSYGDFIVGIYNDKIIAMGALKKTSKQHAQIKRMRVSPDFQGNGFGGEILKELEKRAKGLGYSSLHLETTVQQVAAQRLYCKNGFVEKKRGKILGFDCIFFEKKIV